MGMANFFLPKQKKMAKLFEIARKMHKFAAV